MQPLKKILIAGGGSAGWMTAALCSRLFQGLYEIVLVESEEIGTVGVGEATIPAIKKFNELLGLEEDDFLRKTQGSFKLGIQFKNWWRRGESYLHGFGVIGQDLGWLRCHQYWLRMRDLGRAGDFDNLSINNAMALSNKFMRARPDMAESPIGHIAHAFHFDAGLYAKHLSTFAQARGVTRREGKIVDVTLRAEDGFVQSVTMDDGEVLTADLFVDCSGFRGLIIEQALKTGYEDWTHWLPCDRAVAVPCDRSEHFTPYTRSTAHTAGWQWRIPLQHRTGNGHVYSSQYIDDDEAERVLLANLDGAQRADPLRIRFKTGKRKKIWNKNCVSIGLASGFLEPLESTSLHLIQSAVIRMVRLLPDAGFDQATIDEFNRQTDFEYERIRDFIILHYKVTERTDSTFWDQVRTMDIPDSLAHRIALFQESGHVFQAPGELFQVDSWLQVMLGQRIMPRTYHHMGRMMPPQQLKQALDDLKRNIAGTVSRLPQHQAFLDHYCAPAVSKSA